MCFKLKRFEKCCCFFNLDYGLTTWGYIKLIADTILLCPVIVWLVFIYNDRLHNTALIITCELIATLKVFTFILLDITFNIVFVAAMHLESYTLLKIYHEYLNYTLMVFSAMFTLRISIDTYYLYTRPISCLWRIYLLLGLGIINFVQQCYLIILVKSETKQLKHKCHNRLVHNTEVDNTLESLDDD